MKALPIAPNAGDTNPVTLALATAIKPTSTIGQLVADLLTNKNTSEDRKVAVLVTAASSVSEPLRAVMLPVSVSDATALSGETLVSTIVRDDATKAVSPHTATHESDGGNAGAVAMQAAIDDVLAEQKPARSLPSLINAIVDAFADDADAETASVAITFTQESDGTIKVYRGASAGTLTGKVADITQEAAEETATTTSLW